MKLLLACVLYLTWMGGDTTPVLEMPEPAKSNITQLDARSLSQDHGITWLGSLMVYELHNTTAPNRSSERCTATCMYDRVCLDAYVNALVLPMLCEIFISLLYFLMIDWIKIIHMKRIILSFALVASSAVGIFFSLTSPEVERWRVITTYTYCTIFMLFAGVGVSVSDDYFAHVMHYNIVVAVGNELHLRKPWHAFINACAFQIASAFVSCILGLTLELITRLPYRCEEDALFSQLPYVFHSSWMLLVFALLIYLHKFPRVADRLERPYSLNVPIYMAMQFLFFMWFFGLLFLGFGLSFLWAGLQVTYLFAGIRMGLLHTVIHGEVGPKELGCHFICLVN